MAVVAHLHHHPPQQYKNCAVLNLDVEVVFIEVAPLVKIPSFHHYNLLSCTQGVLFFPISSWFGTKSGGVIVRHFTPEVPIYVLTWTSTLCLLQGSTSHILMN